MCGLYEEFGPNRGLVSVERKCFLAESRASREGVEDWVKKSFGNVVPVLKRRVAGVVPLALYIVLRQPNITSGSDCVQVADVDKQRMDVLRDLWKRYISPLAWGDT